MNILILTPIHPMQIAEMQPLYKYSQHNNVYSIQAMALLAESTGKNYLAANQTYIYEIRKNPKLICAIGKKSEHTIIYGNLDKRTKIKFDHILGYTGHYAENEESWDLYLDEAQKAANEVAQGNDADFIQPPQYYTKEDAQHIFPTINHLLLFLKTLNIKENDTDAE